MEYPVSHLEEANSLSHTLWNAREDDSYTQRAFRFLKREKTALRKASQGQHKAMGSQNKGEGRDGEGKKVFKWMGSVWAKKVILPINTHRITLHWEKASRMKLRSCALVTIQCNDQKHSVPNKRREGSNYDQRCIQRLGCQLLAFEKALLH